jgi:hypothetical protein
MTDDQTFHTRVQALLSHAVAGLDDDDRAERIAWCQAHDAHGVRMYPPTDDDVIEFRWGGRTLAMIHKDVLDTDEPIRRAEFIADVPDTLPDGWAEQ